MATTKKTTKDTEPAKIAAAPPAKALEEKVEAPKAEEKTSTVKAEPAAKSTTTATKTTAKKAATTAKTTAAKTTTTKAKAANDTKKAVPAKKATNDTKKVVSAKKAELTANVNLQFAGKSYTNEDLIQSVKDIWVYDLKKNVTDMKTIDLYVKPEESMAYYVVNGEENGSFSI